MEFIKRVISELYHCYSIGELPYGQDRYFLVASEKDAPCYRFDLDGNRCDTVWQGPGGTMSMAPMPEGDGSFLATQKFYCPDDADDAGLVYVYPENGGWAMRKVFALPHLHRFDVLKGGEAHYILAATIKTSCQRPDDWSTPGMLYGAELPPRAELMQCCELKPEPVSVPMFHNHGFCKHVDPDGRESALIGSDSGVMQVFPPERRGGAWRTELLLDRPASDMVSVDLDGDGVEELVVFAPFHGQTLQIYRKTDGAYRCVFEKDGMGFLHAIWGGMLCGRPAALVGHRDGKRALYLLTWEDGDYRMTCIDENLGPANAAVIQMRTGQGIVAANCETGTVTLYTPR